MADLQLLLPAQVQVKFRTCSSTVHYTKTVDLSDTEFASDLDPVPQGVPGAVKIIHSTARALYDSSGSDPTNQTALDDLAARIAEDYYGWLSVQFHLVYNGVAVPSPLSAAYDCIEIQYEDSDVVTIVSGSEWTGAPEELQHRDPADTSDTDHAGIVPFQNATGGDIAAGSNSTPTPFTATLLNDVGDGSFTATDAATTPLGRHTLNVIIRSGANGWGVWRNCYFYPLTWDGC